MGRWGLGRVPLAPARLLLRRPLCAKKKGKEIHTYEWLAATVVVAGDLHIFQSIRIHRRFPMGPHKNPSALLIVFMLINLGLPPCVRTRPGPSTRGLAGLQLASGQEPLSTSIALACILRRSLIGLPPSWPGRPHRPG